MYTSYTMTLGTAGADWAELMIFIIMISSIMIFAIMMRWLTVTCLFDFSSSVSLTTYLNLVPRDACGGG